MTMINAILAIALGLTPAQPGRAVQTIDFNEGDYAGIIGRYEQAVDQKGTTHLRGFDRVTGRPFDLSLKADGTVDGTVGDTYMTFNVRTAT